MHHQGSEGIITIYGMAASVPSGFRIKRRSAEKNMESDDCSMVTTYDVEEDVKFEHPGAKATKP